MFLLTALVVANGDGIESGDGDGLQCSIRNSSIHDHYTSDLATGTIIDEGTVVTYTCDPGYVNTVSANHSNEINVFTQFQKACEHNEPNNIMYWVGVSTTELRCLPYRCNFELVQNAFVHQNNVIFNQSAFYYCNEGFSYNGTESGYVESTICGADGPSSHNTTQYVSPSTNFSCEPTVCGVYQSNSYTSSVENASYGQTVTFTCTEGYTLFNGSTTFTERCDPNFNGYRDLPGTRQEACEEVAEEPDSTDGQVQSPRP